MPTEADNLLRYRPWNGEPRNPLFASVAMARVSLWLLARQKLLWGLFALALLVFFFFFYAQYLVVWITSQLANETVRFGGIPVTVGNLTRFLDRLSLNGTAHTFGNFIWFQGYMLVIVLALTGSVLIGNDFFHGSLPFYLSKPIGRWHYVLGKCLAIGVVVNVMITLPALVLWVQAGLLYEWQSYYLDNFDLLLGILGYGLVLTITLSLLVVATAVWVRRMVPLVMIWMGLFVFLRMLATLLVDGMRLDERWRLIDLWNVLYLTGLSCLRVDPETIRPAPQPEYWEAWVVVGAVCLACAAYLRNRIRAVEIVS